MPQGAPGKNIWVEGVGMVSMDEARRIQDEVRGLGVTQQPQTGGPVFGPNAPPVTFPTPEQKAGAAESERVFFHEGLPQIANLATLAPGLNNFKAAAAVPTVVDLVRQALNGDGIDLMTALTQGTLGAASHGAGRAVAKGAEMGRNMVRNTIAPAFPRGVGVPTLDKAAANFMEEGAKISTSAPKIAAQSQRLMQLSVDLENNILAKYPQARTVQQAMQMARAAKDPDLLRLDRVTQVQSMLPKLEENAARTSSGPARFLAGQGAAGLAFPAMMAAGLDPTTSALITGAVGVPIGLSQATPGAKLVIGSMLSRIAKGELPLSAAMKMLFAGAMEGADGQNDTSR